MGGAKFWQDFKLGRKLGGPMSGHTEEYVEKPMACLAFDADAHSTKDHSIA